MRKSLRIAAVVAMAAAVVPVAPVHTAAQQAVLLKTNYPTVVSEAGKSVRFDIDVITPTPRPVDLQLVAVPEGWQATLRGGGFVVGSVFGDPEEPPQLELEVRIPPETGPGAYQVVLQGSSRGTVGSLTITVNVSEEAPGAVTLSTDFPDQRGSPTDTFTFRLTLENNTPDETSFSLSAQGPPGWRVEARPTLETRAATVTVEGGGSTDIEVTADPPDQTEAQEYEIQVLASGGGGRQASADLTVEITGTTNLALQTSDQRLNRSGVSGRTTEVRLVLENQGTAPLQGVRVSESSPVGWEVEMDPEVTDSVPPGETREVTARIRPAGDAVAGDYSLSFTATGTGGGSDSIDLRFTVRGSRFWLLMGLLLIAAAAFGLRYVFQRYGRR